MYYNIVLYIYVYIHQHCWGGAKREAARQAHEASRDAHGLAVCSPYVLVYACIWAIQGYIGIHIWLYRVIECYIGYIRISRHLGYLVTTEKKIEGRLKCLSKIV